MSATHYHSPLSSIQGSHKHSLLVVAGDSSTKTLQKVPRSCVGGPQIYGSTVQLPIFYCHCPQKREQNNTKINRNELMMTPGPMICLPGKSKGKESRLKSEQSISVLDLAI